MELAKSFTNSKNNNGAKIVSKGTPKTIVFVGDLVLFP